MSADLATLAEELCRIFLGWKLGEDQPKLAALGEGELAIDLLTGECRCDGDPLPPLFIAEELRDSLARELERAGLEIAAIRSARLDALFAAREPGEGAALELACRTRIETADGAVYEAEARRA